MAPLVAAAILLAVPSLAPAVKKCKAKIDRRTGVVFVNAVDVVGTLQWGGLEGMEENAFFNSACVNAGKAKKCVLADPETLASKTPPSTCTIHLADDGAEQCATWIPGCIPGPRDIQVEARLDVVEEKTQCMTTTASPVAKTTFDCDFEVESGGSRLQVDALKIEIDASVTLTARGGSVAELSSGAITDVKGGLVRLNNGTSPAAGVGDLVTVPIAPGTGTIFTGSGTVLIP